MTYLNRIEHPHYYNDFDEGSVAWLNELMKGGYIPPGHIDSRSILDVQASDLTEFTQCHFFAGIGGWPLALRLAGVPISFRLWTGSPPCQPFSVAGPQESRDDERHLAPHFVDLVRVARPGVLFGEQVASAEIFGKAPKRSRGNATPPPKWAWIDDLSDRLEAARYTVGAQDFPSASVGSPQIRQRTYFGAVSEEWLVDSLGSGLEGHCWDVNGSGEPGWDRTHSPGSASETGSTDQEQPGPTNGFWRNADWLLCRDGQWRAVESGVFQMVDGLSGGLGHLRLERPGEDENGTEGETRSDEVLQDLWHSDVSAAIQRQARRPELFHEEGLLQPGLHDAGLRGNHQSNERQKQSSSISEDKESLLREMRSEGSSCPSSRREPSEQRSAEFAEPLCFVSQEGTPAKGCFPLATGVRHRIGLLKGYGNAINPRQAAIFIKAFFDALSFTSVVQTTPDDLNSIDGLIV